MLTEEQTLFDINQSMENEARFNNSKPTAIAITEDLILIGNSLGELWMFDSENQSHYHTFQEKGKDFVNNSITALAVHPVKSDYILIGYRGAQIVLYDVSDPSKSLRIIKHHPANTPIVEIQFCDWIKQKGK